MALSAATLNAILMYVTIGGQIVLSFEQLMEILRAEPTEGDLALLEQRNANADREWSSLAPDEQAQK